MTKKAKNILAISICCSLILMIGAGIVAAKASGIQLYTIDSSSMSPAMEPGDLAIAVKSPTSQLKPGDIITYQTADQTSPQTKRIVRLNRNTGVIRVISDNQAIKDGFINSSEILGKDIRIVPLAGYVLDEVRHPEVLIGLIYIPIIWIIVLEGKKLARQYWRRPYSVN